jgi:hypothetical protein
VLARNGLRVPPHLLLESRQYCVSVHSRIKPDLESDWALRTEGLAESGQVPVSRDNRFR